MNTRKLTASSSTSEEAEAKYGKDKIKAYKTSFTNMYHALTHRKTSTMMKLVCLLPEEKVSKRHFQNFFTAKTTTKNTPVLLSRFSYPFSPASVIVCHGNESRFVFGDIPFVVAAPSFSCKSNSFSFEKVLNKDSF